LKLFTSIKLVLIISVFGVLSANPVYSQENNLDVGSYLPRLPGGAFYDFSEQNKLNIRVSILGYVRFPGRYVIPNGSTIIDLLSYAGGPTPEAFLDEIGYFHMKEDSSYSISKIDYEGLLKVSSKLTNREKTIQLTPGDIITVPGTQKMYFKDWFSSILSLVSVLVSLSILLFK
jgi:hypothetical protein